MRQGREPRSWQGAGAWLGRAGAARCGCCLACPPSCGARAAAGGGSQLHAEGVTGGYRGRVWKTAGCGGYNAHMQSLCCWPASKCSPRQAALQPPAPALAGAVAPAAAVAAVRPGARCHPAALPAAVLQPFGWGHLRADLAPPASVDSFERAAGLPEGRGGGAAAPELPAPGQSRLRQPVCHAPRGAHCCRRCLQAGSRARQEQQQQGGGSTGAYKLSNGSNLMREQAPACSRHSQRAQAPAGSSSPVEPSAPGASASSSWMLASSWAGRVRGRYRPYTLPSLPIKNLV